MSHELPDHAVPLAGEGVAGPVLLVRYEFQLVVEAQSAGYGLEEVDAKAVKAAIAAVALVPVHHHVRGLLCAVSCDSHVSASASAVVRRRLKIDR